MEPEPILQMCIEQVLDPDNVPTQGEVDEDDLDLLNGSLDSSIEDVTDVKEDKHVQENKEPNENGTTQGKGQFVNLLTYLGMLYLF